MQICAITCAVLYNNVYYVNIFWMFQTFLCVTHQAFIFAVNIQNISSSLQLYALVVVFILFI